jgi:2,3-diaminopropionate biosynthesis protein SbnA
MLVRTPYEFNVEDLYVDLEPVVGRVLHLKCEGLNLAGSVKLKAALQMIKGLEAANRISADTVLVESSSGNLGVAMSMIAAHKGYRFLCVTDPRCTSYARQMIEAFGGEVRVVDDPHHAGGHLGARIDYVRDLCSCDNRYVCLDQYRNVDNWRAHYLTTAPAIARHNPDLRVLFVGAGTAGTLMGCARYFRDTGSPVRVIAVDSIGSVSFGLPAGARMIPGLGASVRPELLDVRCIDGVVHVNEVDTIDMCRRLARRGFLFGGSTGTVLTGALVWLERNNFPADEQCVAISPDFGAGYLESIYHDGWVEESFAGPTVGCLSAPL